MTKVKFFAITYAVPLPSFIFATIEYFTPCELYFSHFVIRRHKSEASANRIGTIEKAYQMHHACVYLQCNNFDVK
ncbi:CLUMA_CG003711, isoform A [Clunio marinus]|uniref:CLUMA_CG003711, isoform A n=1 Tax=Clunio marinus TaxID=568069 RepID=A0A1J1HPK5_9DIPT|nr:CLUMA_CG003711, isoform A [Clunio marinus]